MSNGLTEMHIVRTLEGEGTDEGFQLHVGFDAHNGDPVIGIQMPSGVVAAVGGWRLVTELHRTLTTLASLAQTKIVKELD